MDETLNKDLYQLEEDTTTSEEIPEEDTTTSEEIPEEDATTSEEILEEDTTTSEEILEEDTTTSEEILEEDTTTSVMVEELLIAQNETLSNCYDVLTFIFIVLLFILFRSYVLHIWEHIRSIGK